MGMRIRRNDIVVIRGGESHGHTGKVLKVYTEERKVLVEGGNFVWKHMRRSQQHPHGARIKKEAPLSISRVMLICASCNKPTRPVVKVLEDGTRMRLCRKCKQGVSVEA